MCLLDAELLDALPATFQQGRIFREPVDSFADIDVDGVVRPGQVPGIKQAADRLDVIGAERVLEDGVKILNPAW